MQHRFGGEAAKRDKMHELKVTNRAEWETLGFTGVSGVVHHADRALLLSELDRMKAERLLIMALDDGTTNDIVNQLASRNIVKLPKEVDIVAFTTLLAACERLDSAVVTKVRNLLTTVDYCTRQYRALEVSYSKIKDYYKGIRATAKAVAYSTCAAANFRYAQATFDWHVADLPTIRVVTHWDENSPDQGEFATGSVFDE